MPTAEGHGLTRELVRVVSAQVFLHGCMAGMRMASPLMALREGYSEVAVGVLLSLYALTQVFLALPAGRFADRHGLRRPVGWGVAAATLGAGMAVAWPVFPVLCASALLTGGATGAASIALQRHVGRAVDTPAQRRQAFSWLAIGPAISNFLGPLVAGMVIDQWGFRAAFLAMALFPLLTWLMVRLVRELPRDDAAGRARGERSWDLWREPMFRRLLLVNVFMSAAWDVHTFVVPVLGHERGLSASVIGTILGCFAAASAAVRVVLPIFASQVREWSLIITSMVAAALVYAVYPLMQGPWGMAACSVLLGLALGMVQPMILSMLHHVTPGHRHGEAVGMRMMVINATSVAMPLLFGLTGAVVGVGAVFWTTAGALALGTRLALGLRDDRRCG